MRSLRKQWVEVSAIAAFVVGFTVCLWVARGELGMVWDEPPDIERQYAMADWFAQVYRGGQGLRQAFSKEGLERGWPFCSAAPNEHPPVYAWLGLATWWMFGAGLPDLTAHRLAPILLFAIVAGVLFRFLRSRWGVWPAVAGAGALVFQPRLFADAQLVTMDAVVGGFWFLAATAFLLACEGRIKPAWFGLLAGLAVMSKITGVLLFPALTVWAMATRRRRAIALFLWTCSLVPLVMVAVNPGWWPNPIEGVVRWLNAFVAYPQKIPVYYWGTVYDSRTMFLPWHNSIVLIGITTPPAILLLAVLGFMTLGWRVIRWRSQDHASNISPEPVNHLSDESIAGWALVNLATMVVFRMLPGAPGHDGVRQLAPSLFFLPVLVAYGVRRIQTSAPSSRWQLGPVAAILATLTAGWTTLVTHPFELAYYNALIGGPPGAKAAGFESTYYWDAVTAEVRGWMDQNLPPNAEVVIFPPPDVRVFDWYQRWGMLRGDLRFRNMDSAGLTQLSAGEPAYMIFLMRQGLYLPRQPGGNELFARLAEAPSMYELRPPSVRIRLLAIHDAQTFQAAVRADRVRP